MATDIGGKAQRAVYEIAQEQRGYFTTAQARAAGVSTTALEMMKRRGNVEHISTAVYRISGFAASPWDQYMAASLWPETRRQGVRGTISHASALVVYEISDVSPAKVHITIPKTIRIRRTVPRHLVIHRHTLPSNDVRIVQGLPVTTPERTIRDCHEAKMGASVVRAAITDAEREGWLKPDQAVKLMTDLLASPTPTIDQ